MKKLNKKGFVALGMPLGVFIIFCGMNAVIAKGLVETSRNGVLKKNGQKIWCKVQNKGKDYCDSLYR